MMQKDGRVVYLTEASDTIEQFVSIPDKNTSFILLGKGTSITDAAMRMLAESNVIVGFCGSGGSPIHGCTDMVFMLPQDEYRPTEYAQAWFSAWTNENSRIEMGRRFLSHRIDWDKSMLSELGVKTPTPLFDDFGTAISRAHTVTDLLSAEAVFAKSLYRVMAETYGLPKFSRVAGAKKISTPEERVNSFLDHGNYLAYGYAAVALHGMGIPYFLPVLHGKTRRGALVFDVADLYKDWLVMPAAFECGVKNNDNKAFRAKVIDLAIKNDVLSQVMTFISEALTKSSQNQEDSS